MSTFFQGTNGGNDGIQLFSVVLPQVSDPIKAHPIKNIGFCIVSLVGQVIFNPKRGLPVHASASLSSADILERSWSVFCC